MIGIILADDHALIRDGVRLVLEQEKDIEVTGEAANGRDAVRLALELHPHVAVLDISMPVLNGIEAVQQIRAHAPDVAVVMLTAHREDYIVKRALRAGAVGYVLKDSSPADLIQAIRFAAAGSRFLSEAVRHIAERSAEDGYEELTAREREILTCIGQGKSNKEIANLFGLSVYTVKTHRNNILQKLDLHSAPDLILYAASQAEFVGLRG